MSRIGNKPVVIPEKVELNISGNKISVKGPKGELFTEVVDCLLYTSPSPRDVEESRMPSSA